jgi:hypothetical protein
MKFNMSPVVIPHKKGNSMIEKSRSKHDDVLQ